MRQDGFRLLNQLFPRRWPALVDQHRSLLCFCDACERLRQDGVTWMGHDFSCAVHGMTVRECRHCLQRWVPTQCDCGPVPYRTPMSLMRKSHALIPAGAEALLARLRIVFWMRLSRVRSFLQLSILEYFPQAGLLQFGTRSGRHRHPVSERTCAVPGCEQNHPPPSEPNVSP